MINKLLSDIMFKLFRDENDFIPFIDISKMFNFTFKINNIIFKLKRFVDNNFYQINALKQYKNILFK